MRALNKLLTLSENFIENVCEIRYMIIKESDNLSSIFTKYVNENKNDSFVGIKCCWSKRFAELNEYICSWLKQIKHKRGSLSLELP